MPQPQPLDVLQAGLRAASLRQSVAAGNLANLDTPNFKARAVEFQSQFAQAVAVGDRAGATSLEPRIEERQGAQAAANGNTVDLETELYELRTAGADHRAIARLVDLSIQRLKLAIGGGA